MGRNSTEGDYGRETEIDPLLGKVSFYVNQLVVENFKQTTPKWSQVRQPHFFTFHQGKPIWSVYLPK